MEEKTCQIAMLKIMEILNIMRPNSQKNTVQKLIFKFKVKVVSVPKIAKFTKKAVKDLKLRSLD